MSGSKPKKVTITIGKIGDHIVDFAVWVDWARARHLLVDREGSLVPALRKECGNCHVVMGVNQEQILSDRIKCEGRITWTPVGDNSPSATEKLRIARFISNLPNHAFVGDFTDLCQVYAWMEWKNGCIWKAKCFLAGHKHPDNPLLRELEEGIIDQYYHDSVWLTVNLYDNLWQLIHIQSRLIKTAFISQGWGYPFKSPRELLEEIISSTIDGEFFNTLKPLYIAHAGEFKEIAKLGRKNNKDSLSTPERERLTKLTQKHSQPNIWQERLLAVGNALAEKNRSVRVQMNVHREIMDRIAALQLDAACKPEFKKHGQTSSTWQNGVKIPGIKPRWRT